MNEKHDGMTREAFDKYVQDYIAFAKRPNVYGGKHRLVCLCEKHSKTMIDVEYSAELFELYFNTTIAEQKKLICERLDNAMKVNA
jgi:hypothetical protein